MNIVNIGVIGCASIAKRYVIPAILNLTDSFRLIGIASRSKNKAKEFGSLFNTKSFSSYQSLLDQIDLDAVYIPLPNSLHYEWIEKALNKNINVLVEKSMACSFNEVVALNQLARKKKINPS